jgi:hypothetical protein
MRKRATVDPEVWKEVEATPPEQMTNERLISIFEHFAIVFAKNPRLRGVGVFKQRFLSVILARMNEPVC